MSLPFTGFAAFANVNTVTNSSTSSSSSFSTTAAAVAATATEQSSSPLSSLSLPPPSSSTTIITPHNKIPNQKKTQQQPKQFQQDPIYLGSNSIIRSLLLRASQKKDVLTVGKALEDVRMLAFPPFGINATTKPKTTNNTITRYERVSILSHLFFLYHSKFCILCDKNVEASYVTAIMLQCLQGALDYVPVAFYGLLLNGMVMNDDEGCEGEGVVGVGGNGDETRKDDNNDSNDTSIAVGNVLGWIYISQCHSSNDVQRAAKQLWSSIVTLLLKNENAVTTPHVVVAASTAVAAPNEGHATTTTTTPTTPPPTTTTTTNNNNASNKTERMIRKMVIVHIESVLLYSARPLNLMTRLGLLNNNTSLNSNDINKKKGIGSMKNSNSSSSSNINNNNSNDTDNHMEESYERIVACTLKGIALLIQTYPEDVISTLTPAKSTTTASTIIPSSTKSKRKWCYRTLFQNKSVLWMHMTNNKYSKLRQETYILLSTISQLAPSLLIHVPLLPSLPSPSLTSSSSSLSEQIDSVTPISDTQQQHDKNNKSKKNSKQQNKNKQNQQQNYIPVQFLFLFRNNNIILFIIMLMNI